MTMPRIHNFSAGPAVLPEPVLKQVQQDIWDIAGSGIGIMEHSHRGKVFDRVIAEAEADLRALANVPEHYRVLFLQGGATQQFAMVPMNLLPAGQTADYLVTGVWSEKAVKEAAKFGTTHVAASGAANGFTTIPEAGSIEYSSAPAYVHMTTNNTIYGTQWQSEPDVPAGVPLVADASSDIFSRPIDVTRYGVIYAGAQKNLGPSGVVVVLIREDLIERAPTSLATMLQYRTHAKDGSLHNTPPTMGIYVVGQVIKWIQAGGGLAAMGERNTEKAALLYEVIDGSGFYRGTATPESRSQMNVCFRAPTEELEARFCADASAQGLSGLKGHRSAGGMRASIYNACPRSSVEALVEFMREFERTHG